jgi:hypothetical protein
MNCSKEVKPITSKQAMRLVLDYHYSERIVGAKHAFGLFVDGEICGCVVYSQPASYTLCNGVCGPEYRAKVIELARLVITTKEKNAASFLIGASLKMIGDSVVVSYADCNDHVGHVGYVYQATNWIYTGKGNAEPKWAHPETGEIISYTRRHIDKKAAAIGLDYRELTKVKQSGKHRYVIFTGSKRFKAQAEKALKYKRMEYPKGDTMRHEKGPKEKGLFE